MNFALPEIGPEERTPVVESLLASLRVVLDRVQELEATNQQLRDEIAVLKGQKPRPLLRPSQLETPPPRPEGAAGRPRPGSTKRAKNSQLRITHEVVLHPDPLPAGAVFQELEPYVVQELTIACQVTRYWRARYRLPTGTSLLAPLPAAGLPGQHFGPTLISYCLYQYHHAHVTQPLLLEQLRDFGIDISAGQLNRILTEDREAFHQEKADVLATGLARASYVGVDDTGARHQGRNGSCTTIGNDQFAIFETTASKSRLNFLEVLQGPLRTYVVNEAAHAYWHDQELSATVIDKLSRGPLRFTDTAAWHAHLDALGIQAQRYVRLATEGALLGGLSERGLSPTLVVLSDGAGQFDLFVHASCWIHAERPLVRMVPYNEDHRAAIATVRQQIWQFYQDLKAYRRQPDGGQKPALEARFDALCDQKTGYPSIRAVLQEMKVHKADLLRVLERPEVPLHNNGAESDIREYVKKRKISGSTRSEAGRRCRDTFTSLKKTCRKLGVHFWDYLKDRVGGLGSIPLLTDLIGPRAQGATAPLGEPVQA
jgi:transposase IS66 family protein